MLKEFLSQKGISFRELDVSIDHAAAQELVSRTGRTAVPVIIIDGQTIVGFDRARLEQALSQQQKTRRPPFGAAIADASKVTARRGLDITPGAYIGNVRPGSLAARMGLAPGDIVVEANTQRITSADDLERALSRLNEGSHISLVFLRNGKVHVAEGTLTERYT